MTRYENWLLDYGKAGTVCLLTLREDGLEGGPALLPGACHGRGWQVHLPRLHQRRQLHGRKDIGSIGEYISIHYSLHQPWCESYLYPSQ